MKRIRKILIVLALFMTVAAFAPVVYAYNTIASSYGSKNNQHMTANRVLDPSGTEVVGMECHLVDAGGVLVGSAITVTSSSSAGNPAVAYDSVLDRFLVTWTEYSPDAGSFAVKGRILTSTGSFVGDEIAIGSDTNNQGTVKTAYSSSSGRYLVVFSQGPTGVENISGQFINGAGTFYGTTFTALPGATYAESPNVSFDSVNHRFLVVAITRNDGNPPMSIQGVILNDDIDVFKSSFSIADFPASYLYPPAIAYDPVNSRFLVIWEVYGGAGHKLGGQVVNADGALNGTYREIVPTWTVDFANEVIYQNHSGRFLAAWFGHGGGIYGQEVSNDGTNFGSQFSIVNPPFQRSLALSYNTASKNTLVAYQINDTPHYTTFPLPHLTLTKTGSGAVASDPAGISCGDGCSTQTHVFSSGQAVTLTASTGSGYAFDYWSGACEGTLHSCTLTMTGDLTATAVFVPSATRRMVLAVGRVRLSAGNGTMQSHDHTINCGPGATTCANSYYKGTPVTLSAIAKEGSTFTGWRPATLCPSTDCTVIMDKVRTVNAVFVGPQKLTVIRHRVNLGDGTVTTSPAGIECGTGCPTASWPYLLHEKVTLTATAHAGSVFTGWSPASICTGTGDCTVTMDTAKTVTAAFKGPQALTVKKVSVHKGTGRVTSLPAGIDCGATCTGHFTYKSSVVLSATADTGSVFTGWHPVSICTGTGDCTVTMDTAKTVTGTFTAQ